MDLIINIGNSSIALGLWNERWIQMFRLRTDIGRTADEYFVLISSVLAREKIDIRIIESVAISTVVPELKAVFTELFTQYHSKPPFFISSEVNLGLKVLIENPKEIGNDLIANAAALVHGYQSSGVVADFGTALSITCVDGQGNIRGVSIAPGVYAALQALVGNTAQLSHIPLEPPKTVIGTNTTHSIQSGIIHGYAGLVQHLVNHALKELADINLGIKTDYPRITAVATGGAHELIVPQLDIFKIQDPFLTLEGIRQIFLLNR
jgi:type III pantothenate kinase